MIILRAAENRKIRGICPCPAIREGDTRVGVLRVSGRTNRVYARPAAGFSRCRCFPNISIIALSAPKEKGFPSLLLCFAADGGKMLFSVKARRFCNDKNQVTGACTAKVSKGRSQTSSVSIALWSLPQERNPCATIKFKPHGCAMRRGRGGDRKAPSSLPQERNPLRNKKMQLIFAPKSNEFK